MKFIVDLTLNEDEKPENIIKLSESLFIIYKEGGVWFELTDSINEFYADSSIDLTEKDILLLEKAIKAMRRLGWISDAS